MSIRTIIVVLLAVICGVSAAWGVIQFRRPALIHEQVATTPVVVAAVEIPRGRTVTASDVTLKPWPKAHVPEGVLLKVEDAVDRPAIVPVVAGEPVRDTKLASVDAGRGLAALIPEGMRAYTIQTSRVASNVAGFILPGNRVDVLLTLRGKARDDTGGGTSTTLLQAVEILAVDQQLDAPAENKVDPNRLSSVTVLVTPEQVSLLDLGQHMGKLTLSLRNATDKNEARTRPATLADIRFRQEKPTGQAEAVEETPQQTLQALVTGVNEKPDEPTTYDIMTLRGSRRGLVTVTTLDLKQAKAKRAFLVYRKKV